MGRRATKKVTVNGGVTLHQRFLYRGYLQIACCDHTRSNHPCLWLITWDPLQPVATRPLAIQQDATWYTYGWDLTKNICEIYGQHGYIRTSYTYTPYGEVTATGDVTQPIQWSSEYNDAELALVYYNYRHYHPTQGDWLRRDNIGESDAWNLYLYSANNPVNNFDTLGQSCMSDCLDDNDYTTILISNFITYMLGGPIPKPWVPAVFEAFGYPDLARQARVGIKMGNKPITTIPSILSVVLRAGGRSWLRRIGRIASYFAIAMTALDAMILTYCGWHCLTEDCYNPKKTIYCRK